MLGRYLGPAIDVGPAMTDYIRKGNDEVLHRSTYRGLNEDKKSNQDHISSRKDFNINIIDNLGPEISPDNFPDVNMEDTPFYEMYEDNTTDVESGLAGKTKNDEDPDMATGLDREVPTPDVN